MNALPKKLAVLGLLAGIGACTAIPPSGPSVMVLPGSQSNFNQFQVDNYACQDYASQSAGIPAATAAQNAAVTSAATGAALGAAAGAIIGAASGDPGTGAAIGAGTGMLVGGAGGVGAYEASAYEMQERYDMAYVQCMYAKGHQVPVPAGMSTLSSNSAGNAPPPPPPGPPPPPPPRR